MSKGNKVRTLEFQLACGEAMLIRQQKAGAKLVAFGGSGSNQCVALTAHATKSSNITTGMIAMAAEPANKDNALNYISMFSFRRGYLFASPYIHNPAFHFACGLTQKPKIYWHFLRQFGSQTI